MNLSSCSFRTLASAGPVDPSGITRRWTGLTDGLNYTSANVLNILPCNMRCSKTNCQFFMWECTDSVSALICKYAGAIVLHLGCPMIGKIVGRGNDSKIFNVVLDAIISAIW